MIESTKARLLNESRTFICTNCWDYLEMLRIKDLPDKLVCPSCGSNSLGLLKREEDNVRSIVEKKCEKLSKMEKKMYNSAINSANIISNYGKIAALILTGRNVSLKDAKKILKEEKTPSNNLFMLIIEAERKALKRRFWVD